MLVKVEGRIGEEPRQMGKYEMGTKDRMGESEAGRGVL